MTLVVLGAGAIVLGMREAGVAPTVLGVLGWLILIVAATAVMWATRVLTAAVAFWALGLELGVAYDALW
ncbi:hypothetical protein AB0C27_54530 [Nonomuraea sp. NPDC048882]|uniref:hypothetical protein n=1 Tax=Nonomuraea sp. NPDC048882 TaxID=3154347 RepID=UPI0033F49CF9